MKFNKDNLDKFYDYDMHIETRTIYVGDTNDDGVGPRMAEFLIKSIHVLSASAPDRPIKIILNSQGGSWFDGLAIYDAIKASPCHVSIEVMGSAMSMGSIILQAADERILHPSATIMIHDGYSGIDADVRTFENWADFDKKIRRPKMYEIYSERSKKPPKYWERRCSHDYILTADQAIEEGLADKLFGEDENA